MAWDANLPAGSNPISQGDNDIRANNDWIEQSKARNFAFPGTATTRGRFMLEDFDAAGQAAITSAADSHIIRRNDAEFLQPQLAIRLSGTYRTMLGRAPHGSSAEETALALLLSADDEGALFVREDVSGYKVLRVWDGAAFQTVSLAQPGRVVDRDPNPPAFIGRQTVTFDYGVGVANDPMNVGSGGPWTELHASYPGRVVTVPADSLGDTFIARVQIEAMVVRTSSNDRDWHVAVTQQIDAAAETAQLGQPLKVFQKADDRKFSGRISIDFEQQIAGAALAQTVTYRIRAKDRSSASVSYLINPGNADDADYGWDTHGIFSVTLANQSAII